MQQAGKKNSNNYDFQLWQQHNKPLEISRNEKVENVLNYIHNNPVQSGFMYNSVDWKYSSAMSYAGEKGLIDVKLI